MTHKLIALWNDVREQLPPDSNWKIVRCINKDEELDFYFMAYYWVEEKLWEFFDYEYNTEMMVTHWQPRPEIKFDIGYKQQKDKNELL